LDPWSLEETDASRMPTVVPRFVERRIVLPEDLPRFFRAVESAVKLRNSIPPELGLLLFVCTFGLGSGMDVCGSTLAPGMRCLATLESDSIRYVVCVFVSIPILQFILLRWFWVSSSGIASSGRCPG